MQCWYNGRLFESKEQEDLLDETPEGYEADTGEVEQYVTKKVDPRIVIKKLDLSNKLYAQLIEFIQYNVGDVDELNEIRELQAKIHTMFEELGSEVSSEYNAHKGKDKENAKIREDFTRRKIRTMYQFFAYYIIKYNRAIVEWMESLISSGLFNDGSRIKEIDGSYSNIDIKIIFSLEPSEFLPQNFNMLHKDGHFNHTLSDFFKDSGDLMETIARGAGVFNDLPMMLTTFKRGIYEEFKTKDADGNKISKRISVPVGTTKEVAEIVRMMLAIEAITNNLIKVETIREKFMSDYQGRLAKMNFTQDQIKEKMITLRNSIKDGKINTLDDFKKLQSMNKGRVMSDKEKKDLGEISAKMASAYKYKLESILNNRRSN